MMFDDSAEQKQRFDVDHWIWICICVCCVLFGFIIMILFVTCMPKFRHGDSTVIESYVRIFNVSYTMEHANSNLTFGNLTSLAIQIEDFIGSIPRGTLDVIASDGHGTEFRCDYEPVNSSVLYVFVVRAHYPTQYKCRTATCVQNFYSSIYYKLQTLTTVPLTSDNNVTIPMNFCSIDELSSGHSNQSKKTTSTTTSVTITSAPTTIVEDTTSTTSVSTETSSPITELSSIETEENTTGTTITQVTASSETISTLPVNSESSLTTTTTESSTVQLDETTTSAPVTSLTTSSETISTLTTSTESSTTATESSTVRINETITSATVTQVTASSETIPALTTSTESPTTTTENSTVQINETITSATVTQVTASSETISTLPVNTESSTTTLATPTVRMDDIATSTAVTQVTTSTTSTTTTTTISISKPRYLYVLSSTIQGIWNAVAGGNSSLATALTLGIGTYPSDRSPDNLFDGLNSTCYASRGNSIIGSNSIAGLNTGFYVSTASCSSVLEGFIIQTSSEDASRDPIKITIEGSNKNSSLNLGSSWTLIYNGSTGLDTNPGRETNGLYQTVSNTNSYKNYRLLVTSKRGSVSDFISYGAVKFYGRYIQLSIPRSNSSSLLNVIASSTQAIWNTIAGRNSSTAIAGSSGSGTFLSDSSPSNLFDNSTSTLYVSRGNLTSGTGANAGINTGFYVTVADCQAVLTGFSFFADISRSNRDPTSVTIEGSNSDELTKGTSWQLLYSGPTGLRTTNRSKEGDRQTVNNSISYLSYRFLITSRRSTSSDYVSYSEVKLYGYHA